MIQGDPNENSNLAGARAVPNFSQHLAIRQIVKIELLDEGAYYRDFRRSPKVHISSFNWITKEGQDPQGGGSFTNAIFLNPKGDRR